MLPAEKEKLETYEKMFLSIGVTEDGRRVGRFSIPWNATANAFNMKLPDIFLAKDDLQDEVILAKLEAFTVKGFYIFCPLPDYAFLGRFPSLFDITLYDAFSLTDLSFLQKMTACRMLTLTKAHLKNLDEIIPPPPKKNAAPTCLALFDCVIDDIQHLKESGCRFNELIVCNPKSRDEREKWAGLQRMWYYDLKEQQKGE